MIIIKIGGGESINIDYIVEDLKKIKDSYVIVHGGNFVLENLIKKLGIHKKILFSPDGQSSRYTNQQIIDVLFMAYAGYMNKSIVLKCQNAGINAIGLSGVDGKLLLGKKHPALITVENGKKKVIRDDMTGTVEKVNTRLLHELIKKGFIPVITPPVITLINQAINVDGDKIALQIALSLKATKLLFLIEAAGLLKKITDKNSILQSIDKNEINQYLSFAQGRMKKKLLVSKWALEKGIKQVHITDGRSKNPITNTLYHKKGTILQ